MDELLPVAPRAGSSAEQIRSCLRRLVAEASFEREGSGRSARFHATPACLVALDAQRERLRRAYDLDRRRRRAVGRLRGISSAFAVPESERAARDGVPRAAARARRRRDPGRRHVSPRHVGGGRSRVAAKELRRRGLRDARDERRSRGRRRSRAARAGAPPLATRRSVGALRGVRRALRAARAPRSRRCARAARRCTRTRTFLPGALAMAVAFTPCFDADPLLPASLLPQPWPGSRARELLLASRRLGLALREGPGRPAALPPLRRIRAPRGVRDA
jgi:phenylacetic acid degradation operon negative regulatory protein